MRDSVSASLARDVTSVKAQWRALPRPRRLRIAAAIGWVVLFTLVFVQPLARMFRHAAESELYSYIPLVPLIAGYLLYLRRNRLGTAYRSSTGAAILLLVVGSTVLAAAFNLRGTLSVNDDLSLMTLSYVCFGAVGGFLFLGSTWMATAAFPIGFMLFMVPLPDAVVYWLETASVLASADVSAWMFRATGVPLLREGTTFVLPGIVLRVAQECSGIHSSWVLFITSVVASHLFLKSPWRRLVLVAFVIPLAIVRNSFRILVIGMLCVHIGPHMIDSLIHRQGGPVFFALSLIPLFALLAWLRRQER